MRHFIWHNENGDLLGVHRHQGGWPVGEDLRDAESSSEKVNRIRARMAQEPSFAGFVEYTCACPSSVFMCACAHDVLHNHYFDGESVTTKPPLLVELDGQAIAHTHSFTGEFNDLTPDSTVSLVLKSAVPDGHTVQVVTSPKRTPLIDAPAHLTFTDGATEPLSIRVPSQGLSGIVGGQSTLVRRFAVAVRGWA